MKKESLTITNPSGLHARPVSKLVQASSKFQSDIQIAAEGKRVNAKSILGVMSLGIKMGDVVELQIDGADERQAMQELMQLIQSGLGEEA